MVIEIAMKRRKNTPKINENTAYATMFSNILTQTEDNSGDIYILYLMYLVTLSFELYNLKVVFQYVRL